MKCPFCKNEIEFFTKKGRKGGKVKSEAKSEASRLNGKKGGRPRKKSSPQ
jgi:hypothetical protein